MTDKERAIIMAYTGITMLTGDKFSIFHKYIEDILGRSVWTHELADRAIWEEIKEKSKADFLAICAEDKPEITEKQERTPKKWERPQGEIKKYKPLEPDYNVQCAVENLRAAYWSNEPEKVAKNFTEAEDIIISAICHHGYVVCKQQQGEWIPVSERLPEERINPNTKDFEYVLCSTIWDDVRPYKFGKRIGENKAHFWLGGGIMDKYITAWQPFPEPYQKGGENVQE